jgi:hypothetical protein
MTKVIYDESEMTNEQKTNDVNVDFLMGDKNFRCCLH